MLKLLVYSDSNHSSVYCNYYGGKFMKAISKLAFLTSFFILFIVIYRFITKELLYQLKFAVYRYAILVSIISIGIHLNALFTEKEKIYLIKCSLFIPSGVILYFIVGLIVWYNSGI